LRRGIGSLLLLGAVLPLWAQAPLTWDQCVKEAAEKNPVLRGARAAVRDAEAGARGAWSPFLPQVSLNAGVAKSKGDGKSYSESAAARQNLFSGFGDAAFVARSRAQLDAARAALDASRAQVGADLRNAFARTLFAQEQSLLSSAIAKRRHENLRMVGLRFQGGQENKGNFLRTQASDQQSVFEEHQAARELRVAQRGLARALGRDPFESLSATGTLGGLPPEGEPDFRALAVQTPGVRQAEARSRAARAFVTEARSGFFPSLDASAQSGRVGGQWPPNKKDWSTGLNLSWDVFSGGRTLADAASARAREDQARAELEDARTQAAFDLEDAFASLQDAAERTRVQESFVQASQVRAEIARAQYNNGLISFQDWDQIENDLINNQKALLASRRDAASALAAWEKTLGKGDLP
jgi:outer membrane protein TolC